MAFFRALVFLVTLSFGAIGARAMIELMHLDVVFSGSTPAGPSPFLTVKFEDYAPNTVRITMGASNLRGAEFVSGWYLNLNPAIHPSDLSFNLILNPTQLTLANIGTGVNAFRSGGGGYFDLLFDFPPPPGTFAGKFTAGEQLIVDVSRPTGLVVSDFTGGRAQGGAIGAHYSAAHVQGIGFASGWLGADSVENITPVPEIPGGAWVVGCLVFVAVVFKKNLRAHTLKSGAPSPRSG